MASTTLVAWEKAIFFALLLLAFNVWAREFVACTACESSLVTETNGVMGRRLIVRQLDVPRKGNYSPPPPPPYSY
ncbi:unnamed protein product [Citrullus colocynthis]|uniref:Uncharacterized protein n=1 Tax=Citrullus colocynthis TaxID=252529 RepID=A0ABP0YFL5_9ROSI